MQYSTAISSSTKARLEKKQEIKERIPILPEDDKTQDRITCTILP